MTSTDVRSADDVAASAKPGTVDMRLEVVVVPVSDVDRAKQFYQRLGWRLDADFATDEHFRVIQLTPTGSQASIIFGKGLTNATPGSVDGLMLVVSDIEAARADLVDRGVDVSEVFHDRGGVFHHAGTTDRVTGVDPQRRSYSSFASFADPGWQRLDAAGDHAALAWPLTAAEL